MELGKLKFAFIAVVIAALFIYFYGSGDEKLILKQLNVIEQQLSFAEPLESLPMMKRSQTVTELFTQSPQIDIKIQFRSLPKVHSRQDIRNLLLLTMTELRFLQVEFLDTKVEINANGKEASIVTSLKIQLSSNKQHFEAAELEMNLIKDESWKIASIRSVDVLEL